MNILEEMKSSDGEIVARIYDDGDGGIIVEKSIMGEVVGSVNLDPGTSVSEAKLIASQWLGQVQTLNE